MAFIRVDIFQIDNRLIKLCTGTHTQTINICDLDNRLGNYSQVYRILDPSQFLTMSDIIRNAPSDPLQNPNLDDFLNRHGTRREGPRRRH